MRPKNSQLARQLKRYFGPQIGNANPAPNWCELTDTGNWH
jgi:hypothetical protein